MGLLLSLCARYALRVPAGENDGGYSFRRSRQGASVWSQTLIDAFFWLFLRISANLRRQNNTHIPFGSLI
ncbi:MAG: hypothetical protein ACOVSW_00965 [Candidatus Kapaibacteriota bacterium]